MDAYSEDLRRKIVQALQQRRMNKSEAARVFGVSLSSVKRYAKAAREGRSLSPGKAPGKRPKLDEKARKLLEADVEERPFAKLADRREYLEKVAGVRVSESTLSRALRKMGFGRKRTLGASEQDEFLRAAFRTMVISSIEPGRFVFVDECSSNTSLAPLYGWTRKGERAYQKAPRNWGKNITLLLCSISRQRGMEASLVVEGSTNRTVFETYLEDVLCPTLRKGQVVVMDNLSAHKGERVRELIEGEGCELIYLPPSSPDFNPIEQAFSKLKSYLRDACARSQDTLIEVIGKALSTITVSDAEGYFEHCGYRKVVQSL